MRLLVGGQKGGTGKTTIAYNLAVRYALDGSDVVLLDADPQGDSARVLSARAERHYKPAVPVYRVESRAVRDAIRSLSGRYETVVVDCGGFDGPALRASMVACSLMIVPVQPSQMDLYSLANVADLVEAVIENFNASLEARAVVNCAHPNPLVRDAEVAKEFLREHFPHLSPVRFHLCRRRAVTEAVAAGCSIWEYRPLDGRAAAEFDYLYQEIRNAREVRPA